MSMCAYTIIQCVFFVCVCVIKLLKLSRGKFLVGLTHAFVVIVTLGEIKYTYTYNIFMLVVF